MDRCDRCNARALHRVSKGPSVLQFCAHHYRGYSDALKAEGWRAVIIESSPSATPQAQPVVP